MESRSSLLTTVLTSRISPLLLWSSPLKEKTENKIWAAHAQSQPVKPSGNTCYAPGFLDWITGAHLEGDNCPGAGQASAVSSTLELSPGQQRTSQEWSGWEMGATAHGRESPLLLSATLLWLRGFTGQSSQPLIHTQKLLWSCRAAGGAGAFLQWPEVTNFLSLP